MAAIIKIENLYKIYPVGRERVVALGGISLEIEKGQICCILGTSGSGKSTLLNQLAGLEKPTRGRVLIGGVNISALSEGQLAQFRQKNVGFIFQSYNLLQSYSALENVAMPLMFRGFGKTLRNRRAKVILKQVGLGKRMHHKPAQMSGGQQQRVGIARAFVAKPKIVFADEPTGNLDTRTTKEVMELMVRLCRKNKQTLVLVTHDRELALYADRIITLIDGKVVDDRPNQSIAEVQPDQAQPQEGQPQLEAVVDALLPDDLRQGSEPKAGALSGGVNLPLPKTAGQPPDSLQDNRELRADPTTDANEDAGPDQPENNEQREDEETR